MSTMRVAFGEALVALGAVRQDFVVLDADVAGGTGAQPFRDAYPDRFIQCGIAEQNMMSVAAGIASAGLIPLVTCYGVFASLRAVEQARNSIGYSGLPVKIAASHVGLDVGPDGATHQAIEDLAVYRAIPTFSVVSPASPAQLKAALPQLLDHPGPVYLRTGRSPLREIYDGEAPFTLGHAHVLREGVDVALVATGVMVARALEAAARLSDEGVSATVVNLSTVKPMDTETLVAVARRCGAVVTCEDHNRFGGVGGAVAECLALHHPVPVEFVAVADTFGESGEPAELVVKYGLGPDAIVAAARRVGERKGRAPTAGAHE